MASQKTYRVGILGYGLSAKVFHIPYIQANSRFELHAIVQRTGGQAAKDHPSAVIYRKATDVFASSEVDVVIVSTPPPTHYELVSQALEAGKHVLVEKPFCPSSEECDRLIALAKMQGKLLTVFQNRRWDADFVTLSQLLSEKKLGRVAEFESHFDRYDPTVPPRDAVDVPGSGVIFDLGTHLFDQVLHLYGPPAKVTAFMSRQRSEAPENGPHDACTVLLHYKDGLLVTVKASPLSVDQKQMRFWVRGDKGSYLKHHLDPQEPQIVAGTAVTDPGFGLEPSSNSGLLTTVESGKTIELALANVTPPPTYGKFYDLLASSLDNGSPLPVRPEEARNVIRLVELAKQSSEAFTTITVAEGDFSE